MLGALAFINQGYALLWRVLATLPPERNRRAAELVSSCLGVCGILNGQSLDLHFAEDKTGDETGGEAAVLRVAEGKTVTLIRLTLLLPAMVAGIDDAVLERLDRLAAVWGFAYQIADDFKDCLMSEAETGKSTDRDHELGRPSLPRVLGHERADARLADFLAEGRAILDELAADDVFGGGRFSQLETVQSILENEYDRITARRPLARCA